METKICARCKQEKQLEAFKRKSTGKFGRAARCRCCCAVEYQSKREYYAKKNKIWVQTNKERYNETRRKWRRIYYQRKEKDLRKTPEERAKRKTRRQKYNTKINYIINNRMRSKIHRTLLDKKAGRHWEDLVGYTAHDLIQHLEKLFKPGMSWANYGEWHIDHKIPVSHFNITSAECEDFHRCWTIDNLQPLWAIDNLRKGNNFIGNTDIPNKSQLEKEIIL